MAQRQTHYEVLGIAPTAGPREIKSAYRKAARLTHPDHGGDARDFARATLAYETLIDPDARTRYDRSYGTESSYLRGGAPAPGTYGTEPAHPPSAAGSMRFGTSGPRPSATDATIYLPGLEEPGAIDRATSIRQVHGTPRKRGIFGAQARLARENRSVQLLSRQVLTALPSARLVNGLHAPGGGYIDHALLGGYRLALVHSMLLPRGVYRWDGSTLLRDGKHIDPPRLGPVVHQMQRLFPELNVTGWTVLLSPDGNLHEPVIDYARGAEPGPMNVLNVVNAVNLVREMKMFLGTGPTPHVVDRTILARLIGGMY
ncbi:molecular chaperone DnaJ [Arthrobacter sp. AQ5-05]|uniref:J domain-containing protein n=1 Tax=Arthrobacter sp. AQ5-05 TaxID=2184581 RepID=UPI000DCC02F8|nr:DnaJ domain-containing protein [Arthrobacter sp. AQ5-05]RAX50948.1 molecular chaperone DnaJ [Arthrobacter sp. AQ5-05]